MVNGEVVGSTSALGLGMTLITAGASELINGNIETGAIMVAAGLGVSAIGIYVLERGIIAKCIAKTKALML